MIKLLVVLAFVVGLIVGAVGGYFIRKNNAEKVDAAMSTAEAKAKEIANKVK
ncbi:MAG: hypothetical protein ABFC57_16150 [Veillonellales bacterium]